MENRSTFNILLLKAR